MKLKVRDMSYPGGVGTKQSIPGLAGESNSFSLAAVSIPPIPRHGQVEQDGIKILAGWLALSQSAICLGYDPGCLDFVAELGQNFFQQLPAQLEYQLFVRTEVPCDTRNGETIFVHI